MGIGRAPVPSTPQPSLGDSQRQSRKLGGSGELEETFRVSADGTRIPGDETILPAQRTGRRAMGSDRYVTEGQLCGQW